MSRLRALACVLAASLSSPVLARTVDVPATMTADISGAASVAAGFGVVTSTYRTAAHNRAVGGVANSYHLHGRAIDVARKPGISHSQVAAALQRAGYIMVESLDEGDHSHFAFAGVRTVPAGRSVAALKPVEPKKPAPPPILADEHGTLRIDLDSGLQIAER
jgi:Peptidase M15